MRERSCRFAFIGASNSKEMKEGRGKWEIINVSQDISKFPPVVEISHILRCYGKTALKYAIAMGKNDVADFLRSKGAKE
jgi:hypothetical protein